MKAWRVGAQTLWRPFGPGDLLILLFLVLKVDIWMHVGHFRAPGKT